MKKLVLIIVISIISLLAINQIYYLTSLQFDCTEKIKQGKDLNKYEIFSAMQTHTCLWMFGWIVEPNTANMCFNKQFHISRPFISHEIPEDDEVIKKTKQQLLSGEKEKVRLAWKQYTSTASIWFNGSYIEILDNHDFAGPCFYYTVYADYKPGIIKIKGITLSETVFDYLENKNILSVYETNPVDGLTIEELKQYYRNK